MLWSTRRWRLTVSPLRISIGLVPHQANSRIIDGMGRKLGLPEDKIVVTIERHANTSAASIPLALETAVADGRIKPDTSF